MDLRTAILTLLSSGTGIGVDVYATLWAYKLENGTFSVSYNIDTGARLDWEEIFEKAEDAVDYFLEKREELKLGYDFRN